MRKVNIILSVFALVAAFCLGYALCTWLMQGQIKLLNRVGTLPQSTLEALRAKDLAGDVVHSSAQSSIATDALRKMMMRGAVPGDAISANLFICVDPANPRMLSVVILGIVDKKGNFYVSEAIDLNDPNRYEQISQAVDKMALARGVEKKMAIIGKK